MQREEFFQRYPPRTTASPGPIPRFETTGADGQPVQVHLVPASLPAFPRLAERLHEAQTASVRGLVELVELPTELAVVTEVIPGGTSLEGWVEEVLSSDSTAGREDSAPASADDPPTGSGSGGEGYTQLFRAPQEPSPPAPPSPEPPPPPPPAPESRPPMPPAPEARTPGPPHPDQTSDPEPAEPMGLDYSEFFQVPAETGQSTPETAPPSQPDPPPPEPPVPSDEDDATSGTGEGGYTDFFRAAGSPPSQPPAPGQPPQAPPRPTDRAESPPRDPAPIPPPPPPPPPEPGRESRMDAEREHPSPPPPPPPPPQSPTGDTQPSPRPETTRPPQPPAEDSDSITAEFRKPMAPPPSSAPQGRSRDWAPARGGGRLQAIPVADYLRRLESSAGAPRVQESRPRSTPAPPSWGVEDPSPFQGGSGEPMAAPTVITRAPGPPDGSGGAGRGFRKRDLVIFGVVMGLVVTAAVVAVLLVLLRSG